MGRLKFRVITNRNRLFCFGHCSVLVSFFFSLFFFLFFLGGVLSASVLFCYYVYVRERERESVCVCMCVCVCVCVCVWCQF